MLELPCQLQKNSHLFSIRFILNITKLKILNQYKSLTDCSTFSSDRTRWWHCNSFLPVLPQTGPTKAHNTKRNKRLMFPRQIPVDLQGDTTRPMKIHLPPRNKAAAELEGEPTSHSCALCTSLCWTYGPHPWNPTSFRPLLLQWNIYSEYELMWDKKQALVHKPCFSPTAGTPSVCVRACETCTLAIWSPLLGSEFVCRKLAWSFLPETFKSFQPHWRENRHCQFFLFFFFQGFYRKCYACKTQSFTVRKIQ